MTRKIAVFGGSFNPPGLHHRRVVEELAQKFDEVIVVPCGPRPDKPTTADVEPIHRAFMVDMTFRGIPNVRVELFDLELSTFTRTHELEERFQSEGEIWHVIGSDHLKGAGRQDSFMHKVWENGDHMWRNARFVVVPREGFDLDSADYPENHVVVTADCRGSSYQIRERAYHRESLDGHVMPEVARYIDRYRLYRGAVSGRTAKFLIEEPRIRIFHDERNPKSVALAEKYAPLVSDDPNCLLVIGGDGTMLQAIRTHWRERIPFYGLNTGHLGFLLNSAEEVGDDPFAGDSLVVRHLPLLYVELHRLDGSWSAELAFNDTWIERAQSQAAWLEVKVNDRVQIPKLVADGALLATAAGSTAYARSMGAPPLLANTPALVLVGSNVMHPPEWKFAMLPFDTELECRSLGGEKRPLRAFVDGIYQGDVQEIHARVSRIAGVELAFRPDHDMSEKISQLQFPKGVDA